MKCPVCGKENLNRSSCSDCGWSLSESEPKELQLQSPLLVEQDKPKSQGESASVHISSRAKKTLVIASVVTVVCIVVGVVFAYYFEPVRGVLSASSTTVLHGQSVSFDFSPTQGISPYGYVWSFGDGSTSNEKTPTHTYERTGSYAVTVTVTDRAGVKGSWSTTITVRNPLVFIDTVSYPSSLANPLGDTQVKLFVNGAQMGAGAQLTPGSSYSIELQIIWVVDYGFAKNSQTMVDDKGSVTAPTTQTDLHCVLHYNLYGSPKFTLSAA